jgi:quercetin 2,3-dioxygenase
MYTIHRAADRGHTHIGWLTSWHSFSFGDYYDPNNMGFRNLRVINDDIIAPSMGFGTHGHRDMEIVTYLLAGSLEHRDSLGNGDVLKPGDVQRMSAGTGIRHSEFNPTDKSATHLLQIWIEPQRPGGAPSYEQRHYTREERLNTWCPIIKNAQNAKSEEYPNAMPVNADATIFAGIIYPGQTLSYNFAPGRHGYLHVAAGLLTSNVIPTGDSLKGGDAIRMSQVAVCQVTASEPSEVLLFDLA